MSAKIDDWAARSPRCMRKAMLQEIRTMLPSSSQNSSSCAGLPDEAGQGSPSVSESSSDKERVRFDDRDTSDMSLLQNSGFVWFRPEYERRSPLRGAITGREEGLIMMAVSATSTRLNPSRHTPNCRRSRTGRYPSVPPYWRDYPETIMPPGLASSTVLGSGAF